MNEFNKHYIKLEIPIILEKLKNLAVTPKVKEEIDNLVPSSDVEYLEMELNDVNEVLTILYKFDKLFIDIDLDFDEVIYRASIGGILSPIEIYSVVKLSSTIESALKLLGFVQKEKLTLRNFELLVESFKDISYLVKSIKNTIDYDGQIFDNASPTLKSIRTKLRGMEK